MAKKSFTNQLFQGFVKSAVNQVGRDGGKVISNQVYSDSHATPIRGVRSGSRFQQPATLPNQVPEFFSSAFYLYPLILFAELILSPLGVINHGVNSFRYLAQMSIESDPSNRKLYLIKGILHGVLCLFFCWLVYYLVGLFRS